MKQMYLEGEEVYSYRKFEPIKFNSPLQSGKILCGNIQTLPCNLFFMLASSVWLAHNLVDYMSRSEGVHNGERMRKDLGNGQGIPVDCLVVLWHEWRMETHSVKLKKVSLRNVMRSWMPPKLHEAGSKDSVWMFEQENHHQNCPPGGLIWTEL